MNLYNEFNYIPLKEPTPITEQDWPEGTLPLLCTRTMTYNHERFLRDSIEGVLMQKTTFPVRVCIHDDASTDATAAIICEYQEKYPKLIWAYYRKENIYKHPERRKLLREFLSWALAGKYQALCEGDDHWTDPLKLQKQVEFLEGNEEYSACFTTAEHVNEIENRSTPFVTKLNQGDAPIKDIIIRGGGIFPTASIVFRSNIYDNENYIIIPELPGDTMLIINSALQGKVFFLDEKTCVYRRWTGGVHSSVFKNQDELTQIRINAVAGYKKLNQITGYKYKRFVNRIISRISMAIILRSTMKGRFGYLKYVHPLDFFRSTLRLLKSKLLHYIR
jgi:glycosyltransferase involved in cell wall biosynthesis